MIANILVALRPDQLEALIRHHAHEAAHANTIPERHDHLHDMHALQRRLSDHHDRTEASDECAA